MKKILIPALAIALTLTACQKPADDSKSEGASESATQNTAEPTTAAAPSPTDEQAHDHLDDEHHNHGEGNHDHDHHDHTDHAHDHNHAAHGDAYQCGDKTAHILVDSYEGETEVRLTQDDITYDLSEDVQTKGRFTTDDSIAGDDKGMALVMTGNQAKITTLDDKLLLDCVKK